MFAVLDPATGKPRLILSGRRLVTPAGETLSDAALLSRAELVARGVYPVTDPGQPDPALYRVTGQRVQIADDGATLVYDAEPIPAAEVRVAKIAAIKAAADALLTPTDWLVIRAAETAAPIPATTVAYRGAVRAASNAAEAAVAAAGDDAAAILAVTPEWPELPASTTEGTSE
ncbi:hypothetical protein KL86APRO_12520 [uncultured Alphaproteobacteria bacterium]|uniref:Uncharacterized protein n=1 Tax=uncultured Alphaproteobacteria bacterium TaxID=91750 RepID=A0A212KBP1_9PROT|nr:hypothetical protein KL86APRO_12520 [uncultured Alphaproteobacteria bacterium]